MKKKMKGFTLIELISVLVIMAIIALIVTPLVMSIIKKAKVSADKRSIDAYGRSIELAIAGYLLDNGTFPTSIDQLTIEYSGDQVVCSTTQLNSDSSVYLAGCTVGGRSVDGYTYGTDNAPTYQAYSVGDEITYNNVDYYVIKDSGAKEDSVTLLKATPLTTSEVNTYGAGHVNRYTNASQGTAYNWGGYGTMAYYTSETCGYVNDSYVVSGCTTDYALSEVKYAVDAWALDQAPAASESRLITYEDLITDLGCLSSSCSSSSYSSWIYNSNYYYLTMTPWNNSTYVVWQMGTDGALRYYDHVYYYASVVRPVIVLPKSALSS